MLARFEIGAIAGQLSPLKAPKGDIDLEPGANRKTVRRDSAGRVRWAVTFQDIADVTHQWSVIRDPYATHITRRASEDGVPPKAVERT